MRSLIAWGQPGRSGKPVFSSIRPSEAWSTTCLWQIRLDLVRVRVLEADGNACGVKWDSTSEKQVLVSVSVHLVEFKLDWTPLGTRETSLVWGYRLKLLHFLLEVKMTQLVWRVTIGTYLIQQTFSLEVNHWLCMRGMSCLSIKKTSKS